MSKCFVSAYCRVSTDSDDQLNSLAYQTSYFQDYINKREDYQFYRIYADEGLSGTTWAKRTEFKAMLYDAGLDILEYRGELTLRDSDREAKFNRILVKDVSRWARDVGALDVLKRLKQRGVYVDFITANLSTESMSDDILVGLMMLLAESDSKDKSTKVIFGHAQGAKQGRIVTADKFYGYRLIKESNELIIVPEEADVIRYIYDMYINGEGYRNIINRLTDEGVFTRTGKPFAQTTVGRILKNPAYTGVLVRNKFDVPHVFSGKKSRKLRDPSEWIVHEGRIPRIIDEATFERAQEIRTSKVTFEIKRGKKPIKSKYAEQLVCHVCKSNYIRNREALSRGGRFYYVCVRKKREGVRACESVNIDADAVDELMDKLYASDSIAWFQKYVNKITELIKFTNINALRMKLNTQSEDAVAAKQVLLDEAKERKKRVAKLFINGTLDEATLNDMAFDLDKEIGRLSAEIIELSRTNEDILNDIAELEELIEVINSKSVGDDIREYISKIEVHGKRKIFVTINFFEAIKDAIKPQLLKDLLWIENETASKFIES